MGVRMRCRLLGPTHFRLVMTTKRIPPASVLAAIVICVSVATAAEDFPAIYNSEPGSAVPLDAEAAAASMQLPPGFSATVFAAEPDVQNPIAMAWDNRDRMWVAENFTYAERTQRFDLALRDRVLIFADEDQDGRADSRKVFTDNVQMLTSVEVGRGGVWLMCPPQLLFIPDADGDDVPDGPAQVVLDGFDVAKDNYHNFANGLRWGPDGWLYGRCGHSCPGKIGVPGTPADERVPLDGGIWRFHPDHKNVEVLCHGTTNPWGHDWDQHGELFFINTVIGHLWHMMPGSHFKESFGESMNPGVYERMDMIADHYHFDTKGNWSDSRGGKANDLGGGHAHIGMLIYHGTTWPPQYHGKMMTVNMHGMRINVERLDRTATGYAGKHEPDLMISKDPFFRGVELSVGPDRNVYLLDWSDTGECHEHTGVHRNSGRIYKISSPNQAMPSHGSQRPLCLVGEGKLQTVWADYQAGKTTPEQLRELAGDSDEHVRVWAIRLLTDFWPLDWLTGPNLQAVYPDDAPTRELLLQMARHDDSGLVARVLVSTLQRLAVADRAELASALISREEYSGDHDLALLAWYGMIPLGDKDPAQLVELAKVSRWPSLNRSIARNITSRMNSHPQTLEQLIATTASLSPAAQTQTLQGIHDAVRGWRKGTAPAGWNEFVGLAAVAKSAPLVRDLNTLFGDGRAIDEVRKIALDDRVEMKTRQDALQTLIDARPADLRKVCESLLNTRPLNATAAKGLAMFDDPEITTLLVGKYKRFQASDRRAVIETLVSRKSSAVALLETIASGKSEIPRGDITATDARQIQSLEDEKLTNLLSKVWGEVRESSAERRAAIDTSKQQLSPQRLQTADLVNGRMLYNKTCSQCHVLYGEGQKVGPELTGAQRSSLEYLLENILDPSAVVGKDYRMSIVMLADGRVLNGLVVSQNAQTLTLRTATEQVTIAQEDIEHVKESTVSAMPDGLLQNLSEDQVRDLIAYLMSPVQVQLP